MSENTQSFETAFVVLVQPDGSLMTLPVSPENGVPELPGKINRVAGTYDIFTACREITKDIEESLLVGKIATAVVAALSPQAADEEFRNRLREKVKSLVEPEQG